MAEMRRGRTRDHSDLENIGTNTHAQVDTHISATEAHDAIGAVVGTTNAQTLSGKKYQLNDALESDHTAEGFIINDTAGENLVFGDVVYQKSDGKWWKSDADTSTTMPIAGMAIATINADAAGEILINGIARDDTWTWTVGGVIYGGITAGALTQIAPTGSGDQVQVVGFAMTADIMLFNPSYNLIEIL